MQTITAKTPAMKRKSLMKGHHEADYLCIRNRDTDLLSYGRSISRCAYRTTYTLVYSHRYRIVVPLTRHYGGRGRQISCPP
jgi:hypothetical protein